MRARALLAIAPELSIHRELGSIEGRTYIKYVADTLGL
jgi:hypothetical protein